MKKLLCPKDSSHRLTTEAVTKKDSPHTIKVLCKDCGAFVKWGSHKDVLAINTENAQKINEQEAAKVICPIMSSLVIGDNVFEGSLVKTECLEGGCAWWATIDNACAVTSIAFALLESKMGA